MATQEDVSLRSVPDYVGVRLQSANHSALYFCSHCGGEVMQAFPEPEAYLFKACSHVCSGVDNNIHIDLSLSDGILYANEYSFCVECGEQVHLVYRSRRVRIVAADDHPC